jgi:type I site-specific restriction endonuclease
LRTRTPFRSSALALKIQDHIDLKQFRNKSKGISDVKVSPQQTSEEAESEGVSEVDESNDEISEKENNQKEQPLTQAPVMIDFSALHLSRTLLRAVADLGWMFPHA